LSSTLTIQTPEGVEFNHHLAGPVSRCIAWITDLLCIIVLGVTVATILGTFKLLSADLAGAFAILSYFVIGIGYSMFLEWYWRGQTIGKRLLRLRVIDRQGLRLQPSQIIVRNLLRLVDALPILYAVGGVACLVSPASQRLGDIAAGTLVIRMPKIDQPDLEQIEPGKFNSFRKYPRLVARLRQRISPQEAALYLQAILRRRELEPAARIELFQSLADQLREEVQFPDEATEALTPEQYVRNAVDLLYRTRE